jgi:hypothetical protein
MFKKVFLVIFFLFILLGSHVFAPSQKFPTIDSSSMIQSFYNINLVYAAEKDTKLLQNKEESPSWSSYLVPGIAGIVLVGGISSYWLVFRKKQMKKESAEKTYTSS